MIDKGVNSMSDENNKDQNEVVVEDKSNSSSNGNGDGTGSSTNLEENVAGLLCYLATFITGIIFLFIEKKSKFVRFHAMQSIVFFVGIWVVGFVVDYVPFIGGLISMLLSLFGFI